VLQTQSAREFLSLRLSVCGWLRESGSVMARYLSFGHALWISGAWICRGNVEVGRVQCERSVGHEGGLSSRCSEWGGGRDRGVRRKWARKTNSQHGWVGEVGGVGGGVAISELEWSRGCRGVGGGGGGVGDAAVPGCAARGKEVKSMFGAQRENRCSPISIHSKWIAGGAQGAVGFGGGEGAG